MIVVHLSQITSTVSPQCVHVREKELDLCGCGDQVPIHQYIYYILASLLQVKTIAEVNIRSRPDDDIKLNSKTLSHVMSN